VLAAFADALGPWDPSLGRSGPHIDVSGVSPAAVAVIDEVLGEGEVSVEISGPRPTRIHESIFTGIWRLRDFGDAREPARYRLEASILPDVVTDSALAAATRGLSPVFPAAIGTHSPALLEEIAEAMRKHKDGAPARVVNLTLLPLTVEDHRAIELALPAGPVAMVSRGLGNSRVRSTLARNVWRVQYFNHANALILNTLEIVTAPEVVFAAAEDIDDSRRRLEDLVARMGEEA
jgi:hydrogenase-1 operon protein HyaF